MPVEKIEYLVKLGWYKSFEAQKPVDANGNPEFWLNYSFISFLEKKLSKDLEIFEYGSGHSTIKFSKYCKNIMTQSDLVLNFGSRLAPQFVGHSFETSSFQL